MLLLSVLKQKLKHTIRFMSTPVGFRYLYDVGFINREMDMWFHVGGSTFSAAWTS